MVLRKVRNLSWLCISRMELDHSRTVKGIFQFYRLGRCPTQSMNSSDKVRICKRCMCARLEWFGENARMCIICFIYFRKGKEKRNMNVLYSFLNKVYFDFKTSTITSQFP